MLGFKLKILNMTNLKLMVGDYATIDNPKYYPKLKDIPLLITGYYKCLDVEGTTWTMGYQLEHCNQIKNTYYDTYSQLMKFIQPIPLSPEIMEKIEGWVKCKDNSTYGSSYTNEVFRIRFYKDKFWRIIYKDVTLDNIEGYLHQLQQLIRLFCNKEIEVKWEK